MFRLEHGASSCVHGARARCVSGKVSAGAGAPSAASQTRRASPARCEWISRLKVDAVYESTGDRMRLARSAGKPLIFEEFGAQRDYVNTSDGRNVVISR